MLSPATFILFQFVCFLLASQTVNSALVETLTWSWNDVKMPYPVSDAMSTYVQGPNGDEDGFIIITGGCDHPDGNKRSRGDNFVCLSVTTRALKFDPFQNKFTELPDAPRPRYRHAAVLVRKKVYVIGGRDVEDNLVDFIDVSSMIIPVARRTFHNFAMLSHLTHSFIISIFLIGLASLHVFTGV